MNYDKLRKILISTNVKVAIIGFIVFGFSILCFEHIYSVENPKLIQIILSVLFGILFLGLSLFALRMSLVAGYQAITQTHPLLKAIKAGDKNYLIWVYRKQINTTAGHDGPTVGKTNNVAVFDKDCGGKGYELVMGNAENAEGLIEYLTLEFDIPYLGYADDTRDAINAEYSGRGWPKL